MTVSNQYEMGVLAAAARMVAAPGWESENVKGAAGRDGRLPLVQSG
jgi:hypothetical protein